MTEIFLIIGKAQAGKSSSASVIYDCLLDRNYSVKIYNLADRLKEGIHQFFCIPRELLWGDDEAKSQLTHLRWGDLPIDNHRYGEITFKYFTQGRSIFRNTKMTVREVLQIYGTDIARHHDPECWVNGVKYDIKKDNLDFAIVGDVRFPNECDGFIDFNSTLFKLSRNPLNDNHSSEKALDNYDWSQWEKHLIEIDNSNMSLQEKNTAVINHVTDIIYEKEIIEDSNIRA